jgi:dihydrofolate reductase
MGRLIYLMNVSLDGYVESADGGIDWTVVDEELHTWFNDETARTDAFLYGRRLHEVMAYWQTSDEDPDATPAMLEFGRIWRQRPKIVFSRTLAAPEPADAATNTRIVRTDPVAELGRLKDEFPGDLSVGGPTLAAEFVRQDLVDVYQLVIHPVIVGAGKPFWPSLDRPRNLRLFERREFASGVVELGYERA